jgi:hypothetical protein
MFRQKAHRFVTNAVDRGIPGEPGRGGAVLREGRCNRRDVAGGDVRGPSGNAVPIERSVGDATSSRVKTKRSDILVRRSVGGL